MIPHQICLYVAVGGTVPTLVVLEHSTLAVFCTGLRTLNFAENSRIPQMAAGLCRVD